MFALLFVGVVFTLALAVTLYAFASAKEGFEDDNGFHATFMASRRLQSHVDTANRRDTPLPPLAPVS